MNFSELHVQGHELQRPRLGQRPMAAQNAVKFRQRSTVRKRAVGSMPFSRYVSNFVMPCMVKLQKRESEKLYYIITQYSS